MIRQGPTLVDDVTQRARAHVWSRSNDVPAASLCVLGVFIVSWTQRIFPGEFQQERVQEAESC